MHAYISIQQWQKTERKQEAKDIVEAVAKSNCAKKNKLPPKITVWVDKTNGHIFFHDAQLQA